MVRNDLPAMPMPMTVRIELDHMKHGIVHAMNQYFEQASDDVQKHVDAAIAGFDFQGEVRKIVEAQLHAGLTRAIARAVDKTLEDRALQEILAAKVREAFIQRP